MSSDLSDLIIGMAGSGGDGIVSAGEALKVLDHGWTAQAEAGLRVSWMLHGKPGVGKTELVQTLAARKGARCRIDDSVGKPARLAHDRRRAITQTVQLV